MKRGEIIKGAMKYFIYLITILFAISCTVNGKPEIKVRAVKLISSKEKRSTASAFMLIINNGKGGDVLSGCYLKEFPSVRCEPHDIIKGKMKKVNAIKIPPEEITMLKRGGLHLMFFCLPKEIDNEVTLVLTFKKIGNIALKTSVKYL